ncbi:MAG: HD domain-containing protein [bacterium]|nr:HD domain-containing protein [bacterium]MDD5353740.1 HD domain-containing protein [bacterium]MDD5755902.1 HD domain-containing protein [bacterium]
MVDKSIFLIWEIAVLLLTVGSIIVGCRNYTKGLMNVWSVVSNSLLVLWGLAQGISFFLVIDSLQYLSLGVIAAVVTGNIVVSLKSQSLSAAGLTIASLGLLSGESMVLTGNEYLIWSGRMTQLVGLGFWITFLLLPKIEAKFKKETQKLQKMLAEKETILQQQSVDAEAGKKQFLALEETLAQQVGKNNKLSIFPHIAQKMGSNTNREQVLNNIPEEIAKIWKVQLCGLYLWEEDLGALVLKYGVGYEANFINRLSFKKGEGLVGWTAVESKPVRLADPANDPRFKDKYNQLVKNSSKAITFKAMLLAPINIGEKSLGIIEVINYNGWKDRVSPQIFSAEDEHMLYTLANQIALFLQTVVNYEESREAYLEIIRSLVNAIEARDPYTRGHSEQTTKYAVSIAQKLALPAETIEIVQYAASLHDIGKIGIKENILKKVKKLTADEYSHIKNHPFMGAQILKPIKSLQDVIPIVYHHHERYDGKGYLDGLQRDEIPIGARILSVADSFEAMTSDRPYHKGLPKEEAIEQLKKSAGSQFDPQVVNAFVEVLEEESLKPIGVER